MDPVEVLVIEDNPGDIVLLEEAAASAGLTYRMRVARDGVEALERLSAADRQDDAFRPDLIVLDLKLPRKNGREVLADIRHDSALRRIPLVILSSSESELELARSTSPPAGCTMVKPSTFQGYVDVVKSIEAFRQSAAGRGE